MNLQPHAIHRLHQYRESISTKPYTSRGSKQLRCRLCLLAQEFCTCELRRMVDSKLAFLLLMYDDEVLKPSNSGRLIADLIDDTHGYIWSRTEPDPQMLALLKSSEYQPIVIFPATYANAQQSILSEADCDQLSMDKKPLFILLDGSWREAKKMYRKSPYLQHLPLLSFTPQSAARYGLRKGSRDFQLGTAEVVTLVLTAMGEQRNAASLNAWFELFVESSTYGRRSRKPQNLRCLEHLGRLFKQTFEL